MLRIVTGPFHPHLEHAFLDHIQRLKTADPLAPLAVIVPSSLLLARLRDLLVVEHQQGLLNVHFLTFHQLALRLYEERLSLCSTEFSRMQMVPDLVFEYLLGQIAGRDLHGMAGLKLMSLAPGAWTALWATLRDLKNSAVDPAVALRGIAEGVFDREDTTELQALFTLYSAVLEAGRSLEVGAVDDLASMVTPWVGQSPFLSRCRHVSYYGFYDLTQVQLSLFEAVIAASSATLFFPLCDDPAFAFGRRFFERHLSPLAVSSEPITRATMIESAPHLQREDVRVRIMNAVGSDDELALVCKEIMNLVETHEYRFDEIGVVARSLEGYHGSLGRLFDQHRIPFTSTAAAPVIQEPAVKAMLRLAWLPITGFYRAPVLDVVASPFYRSASMERGGVEPRPDLWHLAVRALGITRGVEEWRRLATAGDVQAWVVPGEESEGAPMGQVGIGRTQLQLLRHRVSRLIEDCQALPSHGGVAELTETFLSLASHHLAVPGLTVEVPDEPEPPNRLAALGIAIQSALEQLRQLDRLGATLGWEAWVRLFMKALERAAIPVAPDHHRGVRVLDAMAARGLPFRALFLLGLNEKIFPRLIREDAFLRDRHRRVLDETLGYKIDEKLSGYEEEQLLFALLRQAARSRLYLLYQRADADGRSQAPSAYLGVFQRVGSIRDETVTLSRRFTDRRNMPLFSPSFLTLEELALRLIMEGRDPSRVLTAAGRKADLFQSGWQALRTIESGTQRLGCHDGLTDPLDSYWRRLAARGVSPTPLEQYARCPFQYFAAQVLRLEPLRQQAVEELPAQAIGELCHAILRDCGRRLVAAGWPEKGLSSEALREQIGVVATEIFRSYEARHGTGYALTWRLAQETVLGLVIASLEEDQREYDESGYRPIGFEVEAEGMLESGGSPGDGRLKVHGRLDRLDRRINPPALRIVDYKYRQGGDMKSKDRDLLTAAIRGYSLQPPLYTLMTHAADNGAVMEPFADGVAVEEVEFRFLAPRWERIVERSRFDSAGWRAPDGQVRETVRHLLDGVRSGRFFILPDTYCDFCEYSAACRRFHGPTWWRAHSSAPAKALRRLRKQKVTGE